MKRLIPILALAAAVFSCSRPDGFEQFVKAADGPVYGFEFEMSDSFLYDVDFYTRVDCSPLLSEHADEVRMNIVWTAPSGEKYSETVYLPLCGREGERVPYRKGLLPPENGTWRLDAEVVEQPSGFCGLGITLKENGTR